MTFALPAARRLVGLGSALLLLTMLPVTSVAAGQPPTVHTVQSAGPGTFATLGHQWLTIDTNLRTPSHVSAWSIDQYLAANTPLPALGHAFKSAETKYGVNALYLLAHAMHETGFGTSYIGQRFHNLFGWNADDRDPTGLASHFSTYSTSIDYVASQIAEMYLSPTGKFWGGAATLRGMRYYASDPQWDVLIARIADNMVLPTLAKRGIVFGDPTVGDASAGDDVKVTIPTEKGNLPDGLQVAYRFVPVAIVEAGVPTGSIPAADPDFKVAKGASNDGRIVATVTAPTRAGRYRLELQLRDSDGTVLTEYGVPAIPSSAVRVYGSDAVSYDVSPTSSGLSVKVTNEGEKAIPPLGPVPSGAPAGTPAPVTSLSAWAVDPSGTPTLLGTVTMTHTLKVGATWATTLPAPTTLPATVLVRLSVGGDPSRLAGSPPGVFLINGDGSATPAAASAAATSAIASPAPSGAAPSAGPAASAAPVPAGPSVAAGSAAPTATPSPSGSSSAGSASVGAVTSASPARSASPVTPTLKVGALTPIDAATRVLLDPTWKPAAPPRIAGAKAAAGAQASFHLAYQPLVTPSAPGQATLQITNLGTAPFVAQQSVPAVPVTEADPSAGSGLAGETSSSAASSATASLVVTAVPAWGPATQPIVERIPLQIDIAPGRNLNVGIALPATTGSQSSYLVIVRVVPADGAPLTSTLFWLRGPKPTAVVPSAVPASISPAAATHGTHATAPGTAPTTHAAASAPAASAGPTAPTSPTASAAPTTPAPQPVRSANPAPTLPPAPAPSAPASAAPSGVTNGLSNGLFGGSPIVPANILPQLMQPQVRAPATS